MYQEKNDVTTEALLLDREGTIKSGSLLEYLYTFFTVKQLTEFLEGTPSEKMLNPRGYISELNFKQSVRIAIEYIKRD